MIAPVPATQPDRDHSPATQARAAAAAHIAVPEPWGLVRLLALIGAGLMLVVVAASAFLRLTHAGIPCADGAACADVLSLGVNIARTAHRLAASTVAVLLLALLAVALGQRPRLANVVRLALAALLVALGLAVLGTRMAGVPPGAASPAVTLANLGGGFVMLALMVAIWSHAHTRLRGALASHATPALRALYVAALLAAWASVALGALASAGGAFAPVHRVVGWVAFATLVATAVMLARARHAGAMLLGVLALLQPLLGEMLHATATAPWLALAHNLVAALLVCALAALAPRMRAGVQPAR